MSKTRILGKGFTEPEFPSEKFVFVDPKSGFPNLTNGVHKLEKNTTYFISGTIDLNGGRIECDENTTIIGGSSENCRIKSTGLSGSALITSRYSLPLRFLTIEADIALDLDAAGISGQALDWNGVNFTNCQTIGSIKNYSNFLMTDSAFLNSQGLEFDGTFGTIGFNTCLFDCSSGGTMITVPSSAIITRRFRVIYSSFVIGIGETGIDFSTSASVQSEGYILDTINFSGGGTYTNGIPYDDNKARWDYCRGINNSGNIGSYYMYGNSTATTISSASTFYKIAGTTTAGAYIQKFDHSDNFLEYTGNLIGFYKVTAILTCTSSNNNEIEVRIAKNDTPSVSSSSISTTSISGKAENIICQDIVELQTGDYIEVYIANNTGANNITVENLNVIIERLN